jgi:ribosomal protein S18 acetylase RimI-like enzyme
MITIRSAVPDDAYDIQNVFYKTWLETYPNKEIGITKEDIEEMFKDGFTDEKINARKENIKSISDNGRLLVAVDDQTNKAVGLCRIYVRENYNQLQAIYILPEFQGKGVGKMLWNEALKFFDADKDILVQVATYNAQAIKFYERLGFADTGKRFEEERHRMPLSKVLIPEMEMMLKKEQVSK